jgi:hypothetical protein
MDMADLVDRGNTMLVDLNVKLSVIVPPGDIYLRFVLSFM